MQIYFYVPYPPPPPPPPPPKKKKMNKKKSEIEWIENWIKWNKDKNPDDKC